MASTEGDRRFRLEVSRDHFTAYLHVRKSVVPGQLTLADIREALQREGIVYGVKEDEKIRVFLENLELYDYTLPIASGEPFTHGRDAEIKFHYETESRVAPEEDIKAAHSINFREAVTIVSVKKGEVIATKVPATQGREGTTVFGQKLPGEWGMDVTLTPGANVSLAPNGLDFMADAGGAPFICKNVIRIDEVRIIEGDIDYSTGNIVFAGTVMVRGSVLDGFSIEAQGDVVVDHTVQAADVKAGGDVMVRRGILTRMKGRVAAEGNVYAKFIENSIVEADGDVVVQTAIMNSRVSANRNVVAITEDGAIIGGDILAFDRVVAKKIGSAAHAKTYVQAGYRFDVQRQFMDLSENLRSVQKKLDEAKKSYDYVARTSGDFDRMGELRGQAIKLLKLQKQMQDDLTEISNARIFNQFTAVEVLETLHQGSHVFIGDSPFSVNKDHAFIAIKWDSETRGPYFTSFDELSRGKAAVPSKKAKTALIIDDSKAVRKTLRMILEKMGLRVVGEAEDGSEGAMKFKQLRPTLVTCDIAMINMNGLEALCEIRNINPKAKVIMISSMKDKKKVLDCIMAGASDYVLKPFVPKRVMTVVRTVLEK